MTHNEEPLTADELAKYQRFRKLVRQQTMRHRPVQEILVSEPLFDVLWRYYVNWIEDLYRHRDLEKLLGIPKAEPPPREEGKLRFRGAPLTALHSLKRDHFGVVGFSPDGRDTAPNLYWFKIPPEESRDR